MAQETVWIGIGSNVGDREAHHRLAIERLSQVKGLRFLQSSPLYETEPVTLGGEEQVWYLNAVIKVETVLSPQDLLQVLKDIEKTLGRQETARWASRPIDLDILFYGDHIIQDERLMIPHPQTQDRRFVLAPLLDLCPDLRHPVLKKTIRVLYQELTDPHLVRLYKR